MYKITLKESANKELLQLPKQAFIKIQAAIGKLAGDPRPAGVKKLKDSEEDLYRIRVGDYRIIYTIDDGIKIVSIRRIGHRKDIYRYLD
jgi:mRNA interferase RelE/StbE